MEKERVQFKPQREKLLLELVPRQIHSERRQIVQDERKHVRVQTRFQKSVDLHELGVGVRFCEQKSEQEPKKQDDSRRVPSASTIVE